MSEEMKQPEKLENPDAKKIAEMLRIDASHAIQMSGKFEDGYAEAWNRRDIKPVPMTKYIDACDLYLNLEDPLTDTIVDEHIRKEIRENSHLKSKFPAGWMCCPSVIFCSINAGVMEEEEKNDGMYLQDLILDKDGNTVSGFAPAPSNVGKILPAEMSAIKFQIPPYEKEGQYEITNDDRVLLEKLYRAAIDKLRAEIKKYRDLKKAN
jgi:hypothetical protein